MRGFLKGKSALAIARQFSGKVRNLTGEHFRGGYADFEASVGDAVRIAAIRGRGLAQLATYVIGADLQACQLQAVLIEYEPEAIPIHAVYPQRRLLSATVRAFVEFLQARFQPIPYWDETLAEPVEAHQQPFVPAEGL